MKRRELIRHLEQQGCVLHRHGARFGQGCWRGPSTRNVVKLKMLPPVRQAWLSPQLLHDLQDFLEARQALFLGHLKGTRLEIAPATGRRQRESAAANDIEGRKLFG
jgi:hypothetical protein